MNDSTKKIKVNIGIGADLAFAVVVLTAYFLMFSSVNSVTTERILLLILLGIGYIFNGIYGFSYCLNSEKISIAGLYFLSQVLLVFCVILLGGDLRYDPLLLLPLTAHSVILLIGRRIYAVNIIIVFLFMITGRIRSGTWEEILSSIIFLAAGQVFIAVFTQMVVDEVRNRLRVEGLVRDLEAANQRLLEYALQIEELTLTKERNRLAREIHDGLGHYLTTIFMQIQAAQAILNKDMENATKVLDSAKTLTQDALTDVRSSVAALRESNDGGIPIERRLEKIVESIRGTGLAIHLTIGRATAEIPYQAEAALFRAAQEGVNNSIRHGKASTIWMTLDYTLEDRVTLNLKDNGVGNSKIIPGYGLKGMRERVEMLGGSVSTQTYQGQGFLLSIWVPR